MSRRNATGLRKPSTKLGARVAAKRSASKETPPSLRAQSAVEASAVDRPTMPEVPEARRSSSGESRPPFPRDGVELATQAVSTPRTSEVSPEPAAVEAPAHADELSLSSSFFASEPRHLDSGRFDSLAPISTRHTSPGAELHFDDFDLEHDVEAPSPAQLARQARMRRIVGGFVGAVAIIMLGLVAARPLIGGSTAKHAASGPTGYAADVLLDAPAPKPEPAVAVAKPEPAVAIAKAEPVAEPVKPEPAAEPTESEPTKPEPAAEPPAQLTQKSVRALERGKRDEAIELATRSIEADPTDALPYLIKGSAFLEKGDMKSARAVFDACVTQAKKGAAYECAAMGGKKQR
jgi:hypothetical protein